MRIHVYFSLLLTSLTNNMMISRAHHRKENGSALVVTIMITSVILILAIVLLQRIIPYSRQIRSMQDSMQAYYTARSEAEIGKSISKKNKWVTKISRRLWTCGDRCWHRVREWFSRSRTPWFTNHRDNQETLRCGHSLKRCTTPHPTQTLQRRCCTTSIWH